MLMNIPVLCNVDKVITALTNKYQRKDDKVLIVLDNIEILISVQQNNVSEANILRNISVEFNTDQVSNDIFNQVTSIISEVVTSIK